MSYQCDVLVIGGGFYGLVLAEWCAQRFGKVLVCERDSDLMRRASYHNQARVHGGYHYPRSILTAIRSRINLPRFLDEYGPAIDRSFPKVYAIAQRFTKVSADQFRQSMERVGAPIEPAPDEIKSLFDPGYIEDVFLTQEYAFNAVTLKEMLLERVEQAGVDVALNTSVERMRQATNQAVELEVNGLPGHSSVVARHVFCCAYAQSNAILSRSGLPCIPLKHELAEMALVEAPPPLNNLGITIMDGPFFSCMPFPARGLHTLSHVRYTPHGHWYDSANESQPAYEVFDRAPKHTAFAHMVRDASRYLPAMIGCEYRDSLWEVKTVLPRSEMDDSRPILLKTHFGLENHHVVLGGKIDNVYDILDSIKLKLSWENT